MKLALQTDWEQLRAIRLAALAESPSAFGSTLAEEEQYDEADWREWAQEVPTFLAYQGHAAIGILAVVAGERANERKLIAMWVHPAHRGAGVSSALLAKARACAHRDGATRLTLWVTRGSHAAVVYRRAGFTETGAAKALPSNPELLEDQLAVDL